MRLVGALIGLLIGYLSGAVIMFSFGFALPLILMPFFLPLVTGLTSLFSGPPALMFVIWFLVNLAIVYGLYIVANTSLAIPPPPPLTPAPAVLIAHTPVENTCLGVVIGMTTGINLAFWSMSPIPGSEVVVFFAFIGFLASSPALTLSPVFQVLVGWSAWLMPMSLVVTAVGVLLLLVLLPIAILQFPSPGPSPLRFNFAQGTIELTVNFSAITGPVTGTGGFSTGNVNFLFNGPLAVSQTSFFAAGAAAHEIGHSMNTSVLGVFFLIVNGIDENIFPPRGTRSWGELCAESNFPRSGFFLRFWS